MRSVYDPEASKRAADLSVNSDLLSTAKDLDVHLSGEQALEEIVRKRLQERWLEENREAIAAYNEHFETHPVFAARLRCF
jgi:antitoxin CcdA